MKPPVGGRVPDTMPSPHASGVAPPDSRRNLAPPGIGTSTTVGERAMGRAVVTFASKGLDHPHQCRASTSECEEPLQMPPPFQLDTTRYLTQGTMSSSLLLLHPA